VDVCRQATFIVSALKLKNIPKGTKSNPKNQKAGNAETFWEKKQDKSNKK